MQRRADRAVGDQVAHVAHRRHEAVGERRHVTHVVLIGDVAHLARIGQRQRERLFAQHVFAGARGGDGDFAVDVIRRGDDHRVDRVGRDHLVRGARSSR